MKKSTVIWLIIAVLAPAIIPLVLHQDAEFGGADGEAEGVIEEIDPNYEPWFEPILRARVGRNRPACFACKLRSAPRSMVTSANAKASPNAPKP